MRHRERDRERERDTERDRERERESIQLFFRLTSCSSWPSYSLW